MKYKFLDKRSTRPSEGLPTWLDIINLAPLNHNHDAWSKAISMMIEIEKAGHEESVESYLLELLVDEQYNRAELLGKAFSISLIHPHNRMYSYQGWPSFLGWDREVRKNV